MTDGSLILDIALGIIVAKVLTTAVKEYQERKVAKASGFEKASAEDWRDLWDSLPESGKKY